MQIINKNIPYKTNKMLSKKNETKLKQKPWISKAILTLTKIKTILHKKDLQKYDIFWYERYKFYRNKINKFISKNKKNYLQQLFQDNFENSRVTWKKLMNYSIRNHTKMMTQSSKTMESIIWNQKVVPNKFNNYFLNVAQNLLRELGEPNHKFQGYLTHPNTHSFFS